MSLSEARRQIDKALAYADMADHASTDREESLFVSHILAHGFSALVEAIAENKPYDGTLNSIRVPFPTLRGIILDAEKAGSEDIGLEDLIVTLRARVKNSDID